MVQENIEGIHVLARRTVPQSAVAVDSAGAEEVGAAEESELAEVGRPASLDQSVPERIDTFAAKGRRFGRSVDEPAEERIVRAANDRKEAVAWPGIVRPACSHPGRRIVLPRHVGGPFSRYPSRLSALPGETIDGGAVPGLRPHGGNRTVVPGSVRMASRGQVGKGATPPTIPGRRPCHSRPTLLTVIINAKQRHRVTNWA